MNEELRKFEDDSKRTVEEIQVTLTEVIESVNNLTDNSIKTLDFIEESVIKDYEFIPETGRQYNDDEYVSYIVNNFSLTSEQLSKSIRSMINTIQGATSNTKLTKDSLSRLDELVNEFKV